MASETDQMKFENLTEGEGVEEVQAVIGFERYPSIPLVAGAGCSWGLDRGRSDFSPIEKFNSCSNVFF